MKKANRWIITILVLAATGSATAGEKGDLKITDACLPSEAWEFNGSGKGNEWVDARSELNGSDPVSWFLPLSQSYRGQANSGVTDYLVGRAFFRAGLYHLAFKRFQRGLVNPEPRAKAIRVASAQCISVLQRNYPSLRLSSQSLAVYPGVWKEAPEIFKGAFLMAVLRGQLQPSAIPPELLTKANDRALVNLLSALDGVKETQDPQGVARLKAAIGDAKKSFAPNEYPGLLDLADVTLARSLNLIGNFQESFSLAKELAKRRPTSGENIEVMAWNAWQKKDWKSAIGQSLSLRTTALKNFYAPQTTLIPAMILLDHCMYQEAKKLLDYYRVAYRAEHEYLSKASQDPYRDLMLTLQGKEKKVPAKVVNEWLRHASIRAVLEENNLIIDEKSAAKTVLEAISKAGKSSGLGDQALRLVRGDLQFLDQLLKQSETRSLEFLRSKLKAIAEDLRLQLDQASQTAALLEVEVLLGISKKAAQLEGAKNEVSTEDAGKAAEKTKKVPEWNWGKRVTTKLETEELWLDELGSYRVPLKKQCVSQGK